MANIYKRITGNVSCGYKFTDAVGDDKHVRRSGIMPCGSGDDHVLLAGELKLVDNHDFAKGDLILPHGRLNQHRPKAWDGYKAKWA